MRDGAVGPSNGLKVITLQLSCNTCFRPCARLPEDHVPAAFVLRGLNQNHLLALCPTSQIRVLNARPLQPYVWFGRADPTLHDEEVGPLRSRLVRELHPVLSHMAHSDMERVSGRPN